MALILGAVSGIEIVNKTFTNKDTKEEKHVTEGVFKLQTQSPSEIWTVRISADDVEAGLLNELKKFENSVDSWSIKPVNLNIQAKESSFDGKKFFHFFLDSIPAQAQAPKAG